VEDVRWSFSISDVRTDAAEHYVADVCRWAEQVVVDTPALANEADELG